MVRVSEAQVTATLPAPAAAPPARIPRSQAPAPAHRRRRPPPGPSWWRRARPATALAARHLGVILLFALPAVVLWWHAWDGHLASTLTCPCGDPGQQVWFVAWPAYAVSHGVSPFFSHALNPPGGVNLLSSTSSPLMGVLMIPVTWALGPVAATTVALTLAPALSAWGCWLACRRFTRWAGAPWVAGFIFGYCPFIVSNLATGHVQLSLLVVPPLALLVAYELLVVQRGDPWRWGGLLGVLLAAQFFISTEILTLMAVVGVVGLVVWAALTWRSLAATAGYAARGAVAAAGVSGLLLALPAWFALDGPSAVHGTPWPGIQVAGVRLFDLWNPGPFAKPEDLFVRIGGYEGLNGPPLTYVGWAVLALAAASVVVAFRRRFTRWLLVVIPVTLVMALGIFAWTSPTGFADLPWLPWQTLGRLPLLDRVAPQRFMALIDLLLAVLVALGLDAVWSNWLAVRHGNRRRLRRERRAVGVALLAVSAASLVPVWWTYQVPLFTERVSVPAWYGDAARRVPPGSVVLAYPFPLSSTSMSQAMVWQALDGMRFTLAGGYLKVPGAGGRPLALHHQGLADDTLGALSQTADGPLPSGTPAQIGALRDALRSWGVRYVVVADRGIAPVYTTDVLTAVVGRVPAVVDGAWVWDLQGHPAAGAPAAGAAALHHCVPQPQEGRAPPGPLPLTGPSCVAFWSHAPAVPGA